MEACGIEEDSNGATSYVHTALPTPIPEDPAPIARPTDRVLRLRRDRCAIENCDDAVDYLASRALWPLPLGCTLRAHSTVEYWNEGQRIGRYPALIADVVDLAGALVTCHVTWLHHGKKLQGHEPRKLLGPMTGRSGCAVQLMAAGNVLGIAEGIETALSAALLDGIPVWAALNTSLLSRFEPPPGVATLRVYGDRDEAGLAAALKLIERLQGRIRIEIRTPPAPAKDWNDVLTTTIAARARKDSPHEHRCNPADRPSGRCPSAAEIRSRPKGDRRMRQD
jgi:putative DNA primase/helicase